MKKHKYTGESTRLGRHGLVKKGTVLDLTEHEAYLLKQTPNRNITSLRDCKPDGFPDDPGLPPKGDHYDLSKLSWKSAKIFRDVSRMRRARLSLAIYQLEASGFPVPTISYRTPMDLMRDVILTTGRFADWI